MDLDGIRVNAEHDAIIGIGWARTVLELLDEIEAREQRESDIFGPRLPGRELPVDEARPTSVAENMTTVLEAAGTLIETVAYYRVRCEDAGFSSTVAEQMGLALHSATLAQVFKSAAAS